MPVHVLAPDAATRAGIEAALAGCAADWPVQVVDGRVEGLGAAIAEALQLGRGVLVLAPSARAEALALAAGATEAVVWPCDGDLLRARFQRVAHLARVPWLDRLHELASDAVEFTDTDVRLLDVNPAFERITGYGRDAVLGRTTADLFRSETVDPAYYEQIGRGLSGEGKWSGQLHARRQDGSLSFQQATIALVRGAGGRVVGHLAIKRDTSRDNLAWSALAGAESRVQLLMDRAAEAVLVCGADGDLADVNQSACAMLGLDREALLTRRIQDFDLGLADEDAWARRVASLGEEPVTLETRWRGADGAGIPVETSLGRTRLVGDVFVLVIARDISERHRAQQRLEQANEELRRLTAHLEDEVAARTREVREGLARLTAVIQNLDEGLVAVGLEGGVEVANAALLAMFGLDPGAPDAHGLATLPAPLRAVAERCARTRMREVTDIALPGDRVGMATTSPVALVDDAGEERALGSVVLVRDVTLERQIDRMKTDFIATVSHELRTPLTAVLGFAQLARARLVERVFPHVEAPPERVQRAMDQAARNLEIIVSEGRRLAALIDDVLDISKMESGRVDWDRAVIAPGALIERAVELTSGLFVDGGPTLVLEIGADLPTLMGDPARLLQVFINLISNAVKFTPEGSVTLSARAVPGAVQVSLTDTGAGVAPEDQEVIFERFRQARDPLTDKPRGTGLGLPICRHIVEHHGGTIRLESALGEGSRFVVTLPLP